jgi:hypothetical protein
MNEKLKNSLILTIFFLFLKANQEKLYSDGIEDDVRSSALSAT